jgi:hypothetical protein
MSEAVRAFVRRYERDTSAPSWRQAGHDLAHRTGLPALYLWAANLVLGLLIVGPLQSLPTEREVVEELVEDRVPVVDLLTQVWSNIGGTHAILLGCFAVGLAVWWRTRHWWVAVIPTLAVATQSAVFTTSSFVIGRGRPDVEQLDVAPPTSGFPSGHTGASTAFYLVMALLAQRIGRPWLRWSMTAVCVLVPLVVAFSRMYRGMHHLTDVTAGLINGLACAWLAWRYLRRRPPAV